MTPKNKKREELLANLTESYSLIHALPEDCPDLPLIQRMCAYERAVVEACDREGWEYYYTVKARYDWH